MLTTYARKSELTSSLWRGTIFLRAKQCESLPNPKISHSQKGPLQGHSWATKHCPGCMGSFRRASHATESLPKRWEQRTLVIGTQQPYFNCIRIKAREIFQYFKSSSRLSKLHLWKSLIFARDKSWDIKNKTKQKLQIFEYGDICTGSSLFKELIGLFFFFLETSLFPKHINHLPNPSKCFWQIYSFNFTW